LVFQQKARLVAAKSELIARFDRRRNIFATRTTHERLTRRKRPIRIAVLAHPVVLDIVGCEHAAIARHLMFVVLALPRVRVGHDDLIHRDVVRKVVRVVAGASRTVEVVAVAIEEHVVRIGASDRAIAVDARRRVDWADFVALPAVFRIAVQVRARRAVANDFAQFAARSVVARTAAHDVASAAVLRVGFEIAALASAPNEISCAAISVEARAVARNAATTAILRVDHEIDARVAALRRSAETSEPACRCTAVPRRIARLALRALVAAHAAVVVVGDEIHARGAAIRRTNGPTVLARCNALSSGAMLACIAARAAHAAVVVVGLQIDTCLSAVGEPLLTRERAFSDVAHFAGLAFGAALSAVERVALLVHAIRVALHRAAAALKSACTLNAYFALFAGVSACPAVFGVAFGRDARAVAERISARAGHHAHIGCGRIRHVHDGRGIAAACDRGERKQNTPNEPKIHGVTLAQRELIS